MSKLLLVVAIFLAFCIISIKPDLFPAHTQEINVLVEIKNTTLFASGSEDLTIKIWDYTKNLYLRTFRGHNFSIHSLAYIPNSNNIISGDSNGSICIWDYTNAKLIKQLTQVHNGIVYDIKILENGTFASAGYEGYIKIWNIADFSMKTQIWASNTSIISLYYLPDVHYLICGAKDSSVRVFALNGTEWEIIWIFSNTSSTNSWVNHFTAIHGKSFLAACLGDGRITIWDYVKLSIVRNWTSSREECKVITYIEKDDVLVSGSTLQHIKIWDYMNAKELQVINAHLTVINDFLYLKDNNLLISAGSDKTIKFWNTTNATSITFENMISMQQGYVYSILHFPSTTTYGVASADGTVGIYNYMERSILKMFTVTNPDAKNVWTKGASGLALIKGTDYFATSSTDGYAQIYSSKTFSLAFDTFLSHGTSWISTIFNIPDTKLMVTAGADKNILIWDYTNQEIKYNLTGHTAWVISSIYIPSKDYIISASYDYNVKIWNYKAANPLIENIKETGVNNETLICKTLKFIKNDIFAAGYYDGSIRLYKIGSNKSISILKMHEASIDSLYYLTEKNLLISTGEDRRYIVWDLNTNKNISGFDNFYSPIDSIEYLSEIDVIAFGSQDGIVRLWDYKTGVEWKPKNDQKTTEEENNKKLIIIGIAVGSALLFALIILVIICIRKKGSADLTNPGTELTTA